MHERKALASLLKQLIAGNDKDFLIMLVSPIRECLDSEGVGKLEFLLVARRERGFLGEVLLEDWARLNFAGVDDFGVSVLQELIELFHQVIDNVVLAYLGKRGFHFRQGRVVQSARFLPESLLEPEFLSHALADASLDFANRDIGQDQTQAPGIEVRG
jgi:hypothetical protein